MHISGILLLVTGWAADTPIPPELQHIEGLATGTAPEIQAAALLRLAESSKLSKPQKQELIERAFVLASQAKERYPRLPVYGAAPDTVDAYRNAASSLRLDRLSIEVRAVQQAVLLSPKLARELTERIERPKPGRLGCESGAIPDLTEYFGLFSDASQQIDGMESALEAVALARTVRDETKALAFAARLATLPADSRAFAATWETLQVELTRIRGAFPAPAVHEGIRKYLITQLTGPRCADAGHVFQSARSMVEWFNVGVAGNAIEESELKPPKPEGRIKTESYWESDDSKGLMEGLRKLRFSPAGLPYTVEERRREEWKQSLEDFLRQMRGANPGFHQTAALLQALIEFTPQGPERDRLFAAYVDALRNSNLQRESPPEWMWRADALYRMLERDPADRSRVLTAFRNSNAPPLILYAWFVENMGSNGMF